ncbi:hypothetical protein N7457_003244 [Penicillium paradoxum]|uniref:uncharacterized protein n=1 Tax=Penicillium paradoxum TaxID=176176 RepID=UPI002549BCC0|nr:uncharacterized protein N7457_003244 [Penicillium paradoxum]KAJ5788254.1 hypothetical protein N7457_003244 [Penicillium paradoxum]
MFPCQISNPAPDDMFTWLKGLIGSKPEPAPSEPSETTQPKHKKSYSRAHSKRVRERERDLRREWTGQKGGWKKVSSKGGYVVGGVC